MPFKDFIHTDVLQVLAVYFASLVISVVNVKDWLSVIALITSILFTLYKWRKEILKTKK